LPTLIDGGRDALVGPIAAKASLFTTRVGSAPLLLEFAELALQHSAVVVQA
jgi:hypothetical protein